MWRFVLIHIYKYKYMDYIWYNTTICIWISTQFTNMADMDSVSQQTTCSGFTVHWLHTWIQSVMIYKDCLRTHTSCKAIHAAGFVWHCKADWLTYSWPLFFFSFLLIIVLPVILGLLFDRPCDCLFTLTRICPWGLFARLSSVKYTEQQHSCIHIWLWLLYVIHSVTDKNKKSTESNVNTEISS